MPECSLPSSSLPEHQVEVSALSQLAPGQSSHRKDNNLRCFFFFFLTKTSKTFTRIKCCVLGFLVATRALSSTSHSQWTKTFTGSCFTLTLEEGNELSPLSSPLLSLLSTKNESQSCHTKPRPSPTGPLC